MRRPRFRPFRRLGRYRRLFLCLLAPPLIWSAVLVVLPTEWARVRLVDRLERASGRSVGIGSVRVGLLGGIRLEAVSFAERGAEGDPWLRVDRLRVDLSLLYLSMGMGDPSRVEVEELDLRIHRDLDGRFEFGDLLVSGPRADVEDGDTAGATPDASGSSTVGPIELEVRGGRIALIDEPNATRIDCVDVVGRGSWDGHRGMIHELRGVLNGGRFALAAQLERGLEGPEFEGHLRAEGVALEAGMEPLAYLVPVLAGQSASVGARLDLDLYLRGRGGSSDEIRRTLVGRGQIALDPIGLEGSEILDNLADLFELPPDDRVGSVRSQFGIGQGRILTDSLTLAIGRVPVVLAGWTDFDGRLDYQVRREGLAGRIAEQARAILADLPVDLDEMLSIRVRGTVDRLVVTVDGVPLDDRHPGLDGERSRLRQIGRRLRDHILK